MEEDKVYLGANAVEKKVMSVRTSMGSLVPLKAITRVLRLSSYKICKRRKGTDTERECRGVK